MDVPICMCVCVHTYNATCLDPAWNPSLADAKAERSMFITCPAASMTRSHQRCELHLSPQSPKPAEHVPSAAAVAGQTPDRCVCVCVSGPHTMLMLHSALQCCAPFLECIQHSVRSKSLALKCTRHSVQLT